MMKQRILIFCSTLLILCLLAGCSSSSADNSPAPSEMMIRGEASTTAEADYAADAGFGYAMDDVDYDVMYDEAVSYEQEDEAEIAIMPPEIPGEAEMGEIADQPRKIIYNVDVSLQTTEFEQGIDEIPALAESMGGFVQGSYVQNANMNQKYYNRSASFTLRIPSEQLDPLLSRLSGNFHLVSQQKHSSDITANYYDTKARLDSLRIQEERLLSMLESAEELQYLMEVERELSSVRYQIESLTTSLNRMDNEVNYSTVTVYLEEVSAYEDELPGVRPVTFGERMEEALGDSWTGFVRFWQNVLLMLIALLPFLPVILIVVVVVVLLARRKKKSKMSPPPQPFDHGADASAKNDGDHKEE